VSVPLPDTDVLLVGKVRFLSRPAFAVGALFGAAITVICTVSLSVAPELSVTVNSKLYTPFTRLFTVVNDLVGERMENSLGPSTLLQRYEEIFPSGSVPLPESLTLLVGNVICISLPAFASGTWLG